MSLDLRFKIAELVPDPSCVYNALEHIISSCDVPEDITERTRLGIRLSLCEFAAAGVAYPPICEDPFSLKTCTSLLETKSTWWTTFSGNYRHISTICTELQPQFNMRQVLAVYGNASSLFATYHDIISKEMRAEQEHHRKEVEQLQNQVGEICEHLQSLNSELLQFQTGLALTHETSNATLHELNTFVIFATKELQDFTEGLVLAHSSSLELERRHQTLSQELTLLAQDTVSISTRQRESLSELESAVFNTSHTLREDTTALHNAVEGIKSVLWILRLVGHLLSSANILVYMLLFMLFVWWARPSPQPDLAFY